MDSFQQHTGKIESAHFAQLIAGRTGRSSERVITGPAFGVDTAVIDLGGGQGLAVSSDPLSLIPGLDLRVSAWLSVHLLANDMATTGFAPQYAQFVYNLPADTGRETLDAYWGHIHRLCDEIGVSITGGHTAKVPGQASTTPGGGTMFLQAPLDRILTADGAQAGDRLVVTKECALVSSALLALSFPETVREQCGKELWKEACDNFERTSVLGEALAASDFLEPHSELRAMHDVTEGGVLGGLCELATASGCGFRVEDRRLPLGGATRAVCSVFGIDPRRCVGAGSMIMAVAPECAGDLVSHLQEKSIPAAVVGELTGDEGVFLLEEEGGEQSFEWEERDPYWAAFFQAMEKGWS